MAEAPPLDAVFRTGLTLYRRRFVPFFLLFASVSLAVLVPGASLLWLLAGGPVTSPAILLQLGSTMFDGSFTVTPALLAFAAALLGLTLVAGALHAAAFLIAAGIVKADVEGARLDRPRVLPDLWAARGRLVAVTLKAWMVLMLAFVLVGIPGLHLAVLGMLAFPAAARVGMPQPRFPERAPAHRAHRMALVCIFGLILTAGILVGAAGGASRHLDPMELAFVQAIANGIVLPLYPTLIAAVHARFGPFEPSVRVAPAGSASGAPGSGKPVA